jgi:hypothetical protein
MEEIEFGGTDEVFGRWGERAVDGEDVDRGEEGGEEGVPGVREGAEGVAGLRRGQKKRARARAF